MKEKEGPGAPKCVDGHTSFPMTIVLDGDKQVGKELACAQSLRVHDLLAAALPGNGSQAAGRLKKILYYSQHFYLSGLLFQCKET